MWKTVLFDLDGTLTDSAEGITKCVQHALVSMGYEAPEPEELQCFVGPPLKEKFMEYAGMTEEDGEKALALYRERYVPTGMFENRVYPRIVKMLELFQKEGITMAVASSKPEVYVKKILEHFGIDDYFKVIVGSELGGGRVHKKDVLEEAIRRLKMEHHKDQIVLVGDTRYDVEGAKAVGISCIGVTYGYGTEEELKAAKPVYLAESVSDVAECVLSQLIKPKNETTAYKIWRIIYPILLDLAVSFILVYGLMFAKAVSAMLKTGAVDIESVAMQVISCNNLLTVVSCAVLIPVCVWFYKRDEWKRKDTGLRNRMMKPVKLDVKRYAAIVSFFVILSVLLNQLIMWSGLHILFPTYNDMTEILFDTNAMVLSYLALAVLAPISEELIFRGLVYRRMRDYISIRAAIMLSSVIFGLVHGNVVQFIFAFLMGLTFAAGYERYKTILVPIAGHVAVNLFSCIAEFSKLPMLPQSQIWTLVLFAAEGFAVIILGVYVLMKWKPKEKEEVIEEAAE